MSGRRHLEMRYPYPNRPSNIVSRLDVNYYVIYYLMRSSTQCLSTIDQRSSTTHVLLLSDYSSATDGLTIDI